MEHLGAENLPVPQQEVKVQQEDNQQVICNNCWNPSEDGGYLCRECEAGFESAHRAVLGRNPFITRQAS